MTDDDKGILNKILIKILPHKIFSTIWNLMSNYLLIYLNIFLHELEFNSDDFIHIWDIFKASHRVYPICVGKIIVTTIDILVFPNILEDWTS